MTSLQGLASNRSKPPQRRCGASDNVSTIERKMETTMRNKLHSIAGAIGFVTILGFWLSTVASELFASAAVVVTVKEAIPWGFLVVVPALAITGVSGFRMAGASSNPRIVKKRRRMPFIAANGLLI